MPGIGGDLTDQREVRRRVDRSDPRRIVRAGVTLGLLGSVLLLLAVTADASYPLLAAASAVLGVGSGATLMPAMTLAIRDLEGSETPNGTTLLALLQQLASALGTAIVAAALTINVNRVPALRGGGLQAMLGLDRSTRGQIQDALAGAVGATYGVVTALILVAVAASAVVLNPRTGRHHRHLPPGEASPSAP